MASNKGKSPSAEAIAVRCKIIDILEKRPGLTYLEMRSIIDLDGPVNSKLIKNAIKALTNSGDLMIDRTNPRSIRYSVTGDMPRVVHVAADKLPRLSGAIYSPMGWVVHQLQGNKYV